MLVEETAGQITIHSRLKRSTVLTLTVYSSKHLEPRVSFREGAIQ